MLIDGLGCWRELAADARRGGPAVFLDRDGVLIADTGYPGAADDVAVLPGAAAAVARLNAAGWSVVLITNQSGVARGYYGWEGFAAVQAVIQTELAREDARLDAVLACGFHDAGHGALAVADHAWRKPAPGMILDAARVLDLDLGGSWVIGDRAGDLQAGRAAGLHGGVLVGGAALPEIQEPFERLQAPDLPGAVEALLARPD